ncbi:MAG TPA: nuclear transport factor 2 family protein [Candidatus Dormibacteraeota bacterium]|nr:nuclear transport factor 2 family protein [Candidatus Dormibacteraeota bacterium]
MTTDRDTAGAADRFREAVGNRDVAAMIDTMSPDVELHSPTTLRPVTGRERVRAVFHILNDLFEDFEYVRFFDGDLAVEDTEIVSTHALMFRCRIGEEQIEGVDVLDIDRSDQIVRFTVLVRPMSGLHRLADSIAERMRVSGPPQR